VRKISVVLVSIVFLAGCTAQTPAVETMAIKSGNISAQVPTTWQKLDGIWLADGVILAYGDVTGRLNRQSLVVYSYPGVFETGEEFNQQYCEQYARLSNVTGIYEETNSAVQIQSIGFNNSDTNNQFCEINYTWQPPSTVNVQGFELVKKVGPDIFVIEGTNTEGNSFDIVKNAVNSVKI
jgi:hypothetical protein